MSFQRCSPLLGGFLILHGELETWLLRSAGLVPSAFALDPTRLAFGLSPSAAPRWTLRFLLFFAFAQSVNQRCGRASFQRKTARMRACAPGAPAMLA